MKDSYLSLDTNDPNKMYFSLSIKQILVRESLVKKRKFNVEHIKISENYFYIICMKCEMYNVKLK